MKDIYIKRNIINESGDVLIDNREGGISSSGQILAKNVDIKAIGDFTQVVDDWLHTNKDPKQYTDFPRSDVFNNEGNTQTESYTVSEVSGLNSAINSSSSSITALGAVYVSARYLNINGLIQSGTTNYAMTVNSDFSPNSTVTLSDPSVSSQISFGGAIPLDGYFDRSRNSIVLDDIKPIGGKVTLVGQILSTGGGKSEQQVVTPMSPSSTTVHMTLF